ncbi:DNA polymerase processivity factor [Acinetobacter phage Acj9]|uniref:Sliding clamp n=1 Tax=Acinetobacter phage Acj9 TaxID=760939 RepID=E5EPP2_9CAUD|nr:DNA polymerase processivity factor [Acinetobacter phage Acj9]ADG60008.1 gp45 sliding clamp [Acinetobacter phage Acj9]
MKFSKNLVAVLKTFATINPGVYLRPGDVINTRTQTGSIYAEVQLEPEEAVDIDVAIYDLNAFLQIVSLAGDDADVTLARDGNIVIKGPQTTINWPATEPDSITFPKKSINLPPHQVEFELPVDTYNQVMKISRSLGAEKLAISNVEDKIVVNAFAKSDTEFERPLCSFKVTEYTGDKDFEFIIDMRNLRVMPEDFNVKLWAQGEMFATSFEGKTARYIISVEDSSTHNF